MSNLLDEGSAGPVEWVIDGLLTLGLVVFVFLLLRSCT